MVATVCECRAFSLAPTAAVYEFSCALYLVIRSSSRKLKSSIESNRAASTAATASASTRVAARLDCARHARFRALRRRAFGRCSIRARLAHALVARRGRRRGGRDAVCRRARTRGETRGRAAGGDAHDQIGDDARGLILSLKIFIRWIMSRSFCGAFCDLSTGRFSHAGSLHLHATARTETEVTELLALLFRRGRMHHCKNKTSGLYYI